MTLSTSQSTPQPALLTPVWALIPCAGSGARAGLQGPKQYQSIAGLPLVRHTLAAFAAVPRLAGVLVVVSEGDSFFDGDVDTAPATDAQSDVAQDALSGAARTWVAPCGGATRAGSVLNGLAELLEQGAAPTDWVMVHDAARCLITPAQIEQLIAACLPDVVGGLLALKLPDTLKREVAGRVAQTVDRSDKWLAQTPQMFHIGELQAALSVAGDAVTDEASALEFVGRQPLLVEGSAQNFKVTYPQDFALAQAVLLSRVAL